VWSADEAHEQIRNAAILINPAFGGKDDATDDGHRWVTDGSQIASWMESWRSTAADTGSLPDLLYRTCFLAAGACTATRGRAGPAAHDADRCMRSSHGGGTSGALPTQYTCTRTDYIAWE
jgi:hypothetical protein